MAAESLPGPESLQPTTGDWPLSRRVGFRFCFSYFILLSLADGIINSIFTIPKVDVPDWATLWPVRAGIIWVAQRVFHVKSEIVYAYESGDKVFDWVLVFCVLVVALFATLLWSIVDRKRGSYPILSKWFRLFLRFALASQMFYYGIAKAIPLQMSYPFLFKFLEPLRDFSPMGILWTSIGISPGYEIFTGCAEIAGGLLLMFKRTVTLGALVCLADLTQVLVLNMTYDVCVKLFSFHLLVIAVLLLAPDIRQLFSLFLLNRSTALAPPEPMFQTPRANRIASAALALLWLWMISCDVYASWSNWPVYGGARPRPALYGIWSIEQITLDGHPQPLLVTDADNWRRMTFDYPDWVHIQHMDDTLSEYAAALDAQKKTLALATANDKNWHADFTYTRPATNELILDGIVNGHRQHIQLRLMDDTKFPVTSRGFHWIQDYPFDH